MILKYGIWRQLENANTFDIPCHLVIRFFKDGLVIHVLIETCKWGGGVCFPLILLSYLESTLKGNGKNWFSSDPPSMAVIQRIWLDSVGKRPTLDFTFFCMYQFIFNWYQTMSVISHLDTFCTWYLPSKTITFVRKNLPTTMSHRYRRSRSGSLEECDIENSDLRYNFLRFWETLIFLCSLAFRVTFSYNT